MVHLTSLWATGQSCVRTMVVAKGKQRYAGEFLSSWYLNAIELWKTNYHTQLLRYGRHFIERAQPQKLNYVDMQRLTSSRTWSLAWPPLMPVPCPMMTLMTLMGYYLEAVQVAFSRHFLCLHVSFCYIFLIFS